MNSSVLGFVRKRLLFLAYASLVAVVLGELGRYYWLLELFSHFIPYYAAILLLATACSPKTWQKCLFGFSTALLTVWALIPQTTHPPASTQQCFISYNLYIHNPDITADLNWLKQQAADVVFLTEATPSMHIAQHLQAAYPHGCAHLEKSPFGLMLLSKQALKSCTLLQQGSLRDFPAIRAQLGNGRIVYAIHPPPPISRYMATERNHVLQTIAQYVRSEQTEVLVMGDMNNTAFSPSFRHFAAIGGLKLQAPRAMPTWRPGLIGIDHFLLRSTHRASVSYGPWLGSDHRPIQAVW